MTRRGLTIVAIAGLLSVAGASAGGQAANPCAAKNPCAEKNPSAAKGPSAAPREVSAQKAGPPANFSATGRSPLLDLPVSRTGQIILGP